MKLCFDETQLQKIGGPGRAAVRRISRERYFFNVRMYFTRSLIWASVNLPL